MTFLNKAGGDNHFARERKVNKGFENRKLVITDDAKLSASKTFSSRKLNKVPRKAYNSS